MRLGYITKLLIVVALIATGILLDIAGMFDAGKVLEVAREYSQHWWLVVVLILLQGILFTFALAGSLFLWVAAPLYPPAMATFILVAGGTLGGLGAYLFSGYLAGDWLEKIKTSRTYKLLYRQNNFLTLFAMRVFPGFPHSLINYSSGILKVNLIHFICAAILGLSIKSYLYARVIYGATSAASLEELLNISTFGPLILLSVLSLLGVYVRQKLTGNHE
ncbi:MAG: VTT domain-containing protein [Proteobacteria bacterium]|nr:VTT domain-containing protein [Pseudomonadota bacterium]